MLDENGDPIDFDEEGSDPPM
jgi:hypothetical protein